MSEHDHANRPEYGSARFRPSAPSGHKDVDRARQAAEALFAPKRPIVNPAVSDDTGSAQQQHSRKPRVLSAVTVMQPLTQLPSEEPTTSQLRHKPRRPCKRVPASHVARLRTWVKYGMTVHQASDMYGVSVTEIERILQKA